LTNETLLSIASSADGTKLVAAGLVAGGGAVGVIYISLDSGVTWTRASASPEPLFAVASSADGSKLVAVGNGVVVISFDSGASWDIDVNPPNSDLTAVASSADGTKVVAAGGSIYTSTDKGIDWLPSSAPSQIWTSVASSADGTKLVAAVYGAIYTSTDSGATWIQTSAPSQNWRTVASSSDGTKLVAAVYGGQIYTSTDSGVTWREQNSGNQQWISVASSADGSKLVAAVSSGQIYTSTDSGVTWTPQNSGIQLWVSVASSADGSKLAAVDNFAVYTSDCTPPECCVPPPANMVLWLPFDETNGSTSANLASPPNDGTQVNYPMPLVGSYVANSLLFYGTNYVAVPDYADIEIGTNNLTIDAWVNEMGAAPADYIILDKHSGNNGPGYSLSLNPSLGLIFDMSGSRFVEGSSISAQQWHFAAVSVNQYARQGFFYVDGALVSTFTPTPVNLSNTNSLWVGASQPLGGVPAWVGALDEVEVYNRALSTNELFGIYSAGRAGKCKPCCYLQTLSISLVSGNSIKVVWGGCGVLEQAPTVFGPWSPIQNAASPYVIPAAGAAMFYRLVCD